MNYTDCEIDIISASTLCGNLSVDIVSEQLPRDMTFNEETLMSVVGYSMLFVISACGNLVVFITLFRNRHRKSRVNLFIMHLCVADMIVTFIMLPLETIWHITVAWLAGDIACRVLMFFRALGFYLSSFILVAISLDRYFAILRPLSMSDADHRGRMMLCFAWILSIVASIPQSIIFHVEYHPKYAWFAQCVTFNFFPTPSHELAYNLFNIITVYGLPLIVIMISYSLILYEVIKKTSESKRGTLQQNGYQDGDRLRRSGLGRIQRARSRTLRMTIVIVLVFIMCWTPYFVISAWWWFDKDSADKLNPKVQRGLFLFAVSNSCMDPIVYGMFTINFKAEYRRCWAPYRNRARKRITRNPRFYPFSEFTRSSSTTQSRWRQNSQRTNQLCASNSPKCPPPPPEHKRISSDGIRTN